jgi:uncharacterized protein (DUF1810 family)
MPANDPFDLERFVAAQTDVLATVEDELRAGRKRSHWIWFIFPQLRGLGHSPTAQFYGIGSLDEARAYLRHPVLGPRLVRCTEHVLALTGRSPNAIFGSPDDLKFHSSMTLFALADDDAGNVFRKALERYFEGRDDDRTITLATFT